MNTLITAAGDKASVEKLLGEKELHPNGVSILTRELTKASAATFTVPEEALDAVKEATFEDATGIEDVFCFHVVELQDGNRIVVTKYRSAEIAGKYYDVAQDTIAAPSMAHYRDLIGFRVNAELADVCIAAYEHHGIEMV